MDVSFPVLVVDDSQTMTTIISKLVREVGFGDIDQVKFFRFRLFSMEREGLASDSTEGFQLALDYEHVFEHLLGVPFLNLGEINKICNGLKGIVNLMHDRTRVTIGDRKALTSFQCPFGLIKSLLQCLLIRLFH